MMKSLPQGDSNDISFFVACDANGYKKLDETAGTPLGELLSDGDVVYLIEHNLFSNVWNCPVYHQKSIQWQIQDFPLGVANPLGGGANLQCIHFLAKTYAKTKEIDPVGGAHAGGAPWIRQWH